MSIEPRRIPPKYRNVLERVLEHTPETNGERVWHRRLRDALAHILALEAELAALRPKAQVMAEIEAGAMKGWPDAPPSTYKCEHLSHRVGWIHAAKHIPTAILARLKELSTGTEEAGDGEEAK